MPDFSIRSKEVEIMDDLNCTGHVLNRTLRELEIINKWLGGNRITINALGQLLKPHSNDKTITIVDLGCGGGDMLRIIDSWGKNKNLRLNLIGIDANPNIVAFAKRNLAVYPHIQFQTLNIFSEEFQRQKYDIVIGTLFYHHFSSEQLIHFFRKLRDQVTIGFIINDIHRHWLAYYSIKILTQGLSKSAMVKYDAPLSVLRAFKRSELRKMLEATAIENFTIRWKWAFRWQVIAKFGS
jgi:2-polyprenyl-3-methyl-5-hydroxy-6-metoxy-1,4-benzoquinol methylase